MLSFFSYIYVGPFCTFTTPFHITKIFILFSGFRLQHRDAGFHSTLTSIFIAFSTIATAAHSSHFDYYLLRFGFDLWQFTITKVVTYNNIFERKLSPLLLLVLLLHVYLGP